jgi:hypothetical protein
MSEVPELAVEDFRRAATAARGETLNALYEAAGITPGPTRERLCVEGLELPLRLFVALALRQRHGPDFPTRALTLRQARDLVRDLGLASADSYAAGWPIRTG